MATDNPLQRFYRREAFRVKLPSRGHFYSDGVVDLDDNAELGILPMTASDELTLKTPDALLTGKAIIDVINSCAPEVKNPKKLLSCDIDTIMISIRRASYGDEADINSDCPNCEHVNTYGLDLDTLLNQSETLENSYEVVLPQGLTVFLTPGTYDTVIKQYRAAFENSKAQRAIAQSISDEAALNVLSQAFREMAKLNFDLIAEAIVKIIFTDEEGEEQVVSDKNQIREFIVNIDKKSVDIIDTKIAEINKVGIQRVIQALCTECGHKWEASIEFNPVNFS